MGATSIGWTDFSINPIRARLGQAVGHYCEKVSPGCKNCYSSRLQPRFGLPQFQEQRGDTAGVFLDGGKLAEVLRRKKPTKFFWCDMTDLFGEWVSFEWIAACFGVMAATPQHTHQVLTKRPNRMKTWFAWAARHGHVCHPTAVCFANTRDVLRGENIKAAWGRPFDVDDALALAVRKWPLPNVWLGVSVEDQKRADERIPHLMQTPAAVRFVSAEPLLGPVDLGLSSATCSCCKRWPSRWVTLPGGAHSDLYEDGFPTAVATAGTYRAESNKHGALSVHTADGKLLGIRPAEFTALPGLDWVIAGCESGPGARPTHPDWYRSLRDQCQAAGVPFFLKQAKAEPDCSCGHAQRDHNDFEGCCRDCLCTASPSITASTWSTTKAGGVIAAPYLDGRQWLEFPGDRSPTLRQPDPEKAKGSAT